MRWCLCVLLLSIGVVGCTQVEHFQNNDTDYLTIEDMKRYVLNSTSYQVTKCIVPCNSSEVNCSLIFQVTLDDENDVTSSFFNITVQMHVQEPFVEITRFNIRKISEPESKKAVIQVKSKEYFELAVGIGSLNANVVFGKYFPIGIVSWPANFDNRNNTCTGNIAFSSYTQTYFNKHAKTPDDGISEFRKMLLKTTSGNLTDLYISFLTEYFVISGEWIIPLLSGLRISSLSLNDANWTQSLEPVFKNHEVLTKLSLRNNNLLSIDPENFKSMISLKYLDLSRNCLAELPGNLPITLKSLDISLNPLKRGGRKLTNLTNLEELILKKVNLQRTSNYLIKLVHLQKLDISSCNLTGLPNLTESNYITHLDISNNSMKSVPLNFTKMLPNLKFLNFSHNELNIYPELNFHSLTILDLSHNQLKEVPSLKSGQVFEKLLLGHNNIRSWNNTKQFNLNGTKFYFLDLRNNEIETMSETMITALKTVYAVNLDGNPFDCDPCQILPLHEWLQSNGTTVKNIQKLTCKHPPSKYGSYITKLDVICSTDNTSTLVVVGISIGVIVALGLLIFIIAYKYRFELSYLRHLLMVKRNRGRSQSNQQILYDAFVCYSSSDRQFVIGELMPYLEKSPQRYRLCLHERDFALGNYITQNIVSCMQASRTTLVILSKGFVHSQWCNWELEMAKHQMFEDGRDFLILLELERLDRTTLPRHLRYLMETRTYLEWPEETASSNVWKRLQNALGDSIYSNTKHSIREDHRTSVRSNKRTSQAVREISC